MLVEQRADVSRRLCSCIDVEQVKEKPWRGGSLEGGVWRYKHNNQPDKDEDKDDDEDDDNNDEDEDE